jgi:hypothetical protein
MRWLAPVLAITISIPLAPLGMAQDALPKLNIVIVEGEGAINNIRLRTAREPIVRVEDENHKPVAGAVVVFALSNQGASGSFTGGAHSLSVVTDSQGQAAARGFHPNNVQGQYQMHVTASSNGRTANTNITESNVVAAATAATTAAAAGISGKLIAIIVIAAAAAAGAGAYAATHGGGGTNTTVTNGPITITPGTGAVGPPK